MSLSYDYYPAVLFAIEKISLGYTKTAACDMANITIATFTNYINSNETLREALQDAEQRGYDAMADALLQPDNHDLYGHGDSKMAKVQSDNLKWYLSKKKPKEYGDRVTVDVNITADKAITAAIAQGQNRVKQLTYAPSEVIEVGQATDDQLIAEMCS